MPATKYGEKNIIYVNFGNRKKSEQFGIKIGKEEKELRCGNDGYSERIERTRRQIDEQLSVLSGTIQFMERLPKRSSGVNEDDILRTERIYRCGKELLNNIQDYIYLVDEKADLR